MVKSYNLIGGDMVESVTDTGRWVQKSDWDSLNFALQQMRTRFRESQFAAEQAEVRFKRLRKKMESMAGSILDQIDDA